MTVSHIVVMLRKEIRRALAQILSFLVYSFQNLVPYSMFNPVAEYARDEDSLKSVQTMGFGLLQALYYIITSKDNIKKALQASTAVESGSMCLCRKRPNTSQAVVESNLQNTQTVRRQLPRSYK